MKEVGASGGVWRHQGLSFYSPFQLGPPVGGDDQEVDVVVEVRQPEPLGAPPRGTLVSEVRDGDRLLYSLYDAGDEYVTRVHALCQFRLDKGAMRVVCELEPGTDPAWLPVFLTGTVSSLLLTLRGHAVLHGSAVSWGEATVVFLGPSGTGKTTLAALCCAVGAKLVSDDLVVLKPEDGAVAIAGLSSELRLRRPVQELARLFPEGTPMRDTVDGGIAVAPVRADSERNRISVVVMPQPARNLPGIQTRGLSPLAAVVQLLGNARTPGLVAATLQEGYFAAVTDLAALVPVIEATVPWGPPYLPAVARQLLDSVLAVA